MVSCYILPADLQPCLSEDPDPRLPGFCNTNTLINAKPKIYGFGEALYNKLEYCM